MMEKIRRFFESNTDKAKKELELCNEELSLATTTIRITEEEISRSFTPDGAITREGLEIELTGLDEERRQTTKPEDANAQNLIHGRQKAITDLLGLELKWKKQLLTYAEHRSEIEQRISELNEQINPQE